MNQVLPSVGTAAAAADPACCWQTVHAEDVDDGGHEELVKTGDVLAGA